MIAGLVRATSQTAFALAAVMVACSVACSNASDHPAAGGGGSTTTVGGGGSGSGTGDSGAIDGGGGALDSAAAPADLCEGAKQEGDLIDELRIAGDPPVPLGGTIVPGTYALASLNAYGAPQTSDGGDGGEASGGGGPTGISARATLVVTATSLRFFGARGPAASVPADVATGFTYVRNGTNLDAKAFCPTPGASKSIAYSVVGGALVLFPDALHREVYGPR